MKNYFKVFIVFYLICVTGFGCATLKAPVMDDGNKIPVSILIYRGDPDSMGKKQYKFRNEVGEYMENHIISIFNRAGYDAKLIRKPDEFTPGKNKYLININITSYNPGSTAARMLVGFGAGATSLDIQYNLLCESEKPLLDTKDGVGSSRSWQVCVIKLNENILKNVTNKINEVLK